MSSSLTSIILAAGMGSRLGREGPKCLVEVGGRPILMRTLEALRMANLRDVVIVCGFHAPLVQRFVSESATELRVKFVVNEQFSTTGTARSLALGIEVVPHDRDVLIIEADVAFEPAVLQRLLTSANADAIAVARELPVYSGSVVTLGREGYVEHWYHERTRPLSLARGAAWKTVNLNRFSAATCFDCLMPALMSTLAVEGERAPAELAYSSVIASAATRVAGVDVGEYAWFEVDTPDDHALAERRFESVD
jgi:choline kinase